MGWKLEFHFKDFPKISLYGFVIAIDKSNAIAKFNSDYPNFKECVITEVEPTE